MEWVADALSGQVDGISSMEVENLGDGIGQVSELGKLTLTNDSGPPREVIVKTRTNVTDMHELGVSYGMYEREVNFYNNMANEIPIHTPEVFYSAWDPETERVAILMEFMDGWYSPDQIEGATREEMEKAIRGLAPLTATYWNSRLRQSVDWLGDSLADYYLKISADYLTSREGFLERFADRLPADIESTVDRIGAAKGGLLHAQAQGTYALTHWDFRVENMFFKQDQPDVVVIDWQLLMWMKPAWDFTYLCFTNLPVENRRAWFADLAGLYLEELARYGVTDYSMDELMDDVRLCLLGISVVPVVGGANIDRSNSRSMDLVGSVAERAFAGIEDLDCMSVLDEIAAASP